MISRFLNYQNPYNIWPSGNYTNTTDFDSNLLPAEDVSVDAVVTSLYFNTVVFILLMAFYEFIRRLLPAVYSSQKRMTHMMPERADVSSSPDEEQGEYTPPPTMAPEDKDTFSDAAAKTHKFSSSLNSLPDDVPLDWVAPVFGVPWSKVRRTAGLDGYFFLRYIRMNIRITAVTSFWFFLILVPLYVTGAGNPKYPAQGWYRISASNLSGDEWRRWAPCICAYFFSAFILFVVKQEYRHFLELRQDFLARGNNHVNPQHHYSLMIEDIPYALRSDRALKEYFENLFPGKVHSASAVLKLPDLEECSNRCMRMCRRLEKSIAYLHATGERPTHIVGRARLRILGVDLQPLDCRQCFYCEGEDTVVELEDDHLAQRPARGVRVDSISYYTQDLAAQSRELFRMQKKKESIAKSGNQSIRAEHWFDKVVLEVSQVASRIMDDSALDNDLVSPSDSMESSKGLRFIRAENMPSGYGTISPVTLANRLSPADAITPVAGSGTRDAPLVENDHLPPSPSERKYNPAPFSRDEYRNRLRRWAGRLGLDFVVAIFKLLNKQLDVALESVVSATMSSTGFVTFLDLSSTTCAASASLSAKSSVLNASIAPEPREIIWQNAHVSASICNWRERVVNVFLFLGVVLWSFPLAAIQVFAKAQNLAQIPGMEWILTYDEGALMRFMNGYLPVVALLCLILILPVLFEYIALKIERRKTYSDVQASMLKRYFSYQLANIYITVTAGSLLKSLADILDHPSNILALLGESLPTMVGYFVALLVTKIMAGLPMVFLRFGALSRMIFLKTLSNQPKLTQRELDAIYRLENVQYGWEFPTQLLVVVIVFTYAIICPVILPVGLVYFVGSLLVYKKQILYVYSPTYESGGAMFPLAVQRTIFGLVCGQMTLLGYAVTRGWYYQNLVLIPLPIMTIYAMGYFYQTYVVPSNRLSLERAREYDRQVSARAAREERTQQSPNAGHALRQRQFDKSNYRQPVLTVLATEPWTYRRGVDDEETLNVRERLRDINRFVTMTGGTPQEQL